MSETLKQETPETDAAEDEYTFTVSSDLSRKLETDRNRWRSVAEQAEKALRSISAQRANRYESTAVVCANIADGALAAFDSLRKEATGE